MTKLIILEGPDCCGKTTLGLHLARFYRGIYIHATASKALFQALPDYHKSLMEIVEANLALEMPVIMDRFWPSETTYGLELFRKESGYRNVAEHLHQRITKQNYVYIFCMSPTGWGRYELDHYDPAHSLNFEQYMQVFKNYDNLAHDMQRRGDKTLRYQLDTQGSGEALAAFIGEIEHALS